MRELDLIAGPVRVDGAVSVEATGDGVQPWRIDHTEQALHHPALVAAASCPAGVRLRSRSDTRRVAVAYEATMLPGHEGYDLPVHFDLVIDGHAVVTQTAVGPGPGQIRFVDLPAGPKDLELWLPTAPGIHLRSVEQDTAAAESPPDDRDHRPRWIVYGSSITQCSGIRPTRTWPALVARRLGWHLTCLGYTGQCHLDPLVARMIARLPADRITAKIGINVHNLATLRERTFAPAVHGFLAAVRDGHPDTPMTVVSPVVSPEREHSARSVLVTPTWTREVAGDLSLADMRRALADVVAVRRAAGDHRLGYVDGHALLGPADAGLLPDGLHPNAPGYRVMAERFAARATTPADSRDGHADRATARAVAPAGAEAPGAVADAPAGADAIAPSGAAADAVDADVAAAAVEGDAHELGSNRRRS